MPEYEFIVQINGAFQTGTLNCPHDKYAVEYGVSQLWGKGAKVTYLQIKQGDRVVHRE